MSDTAFIKTLQQKAKEQAILSRNSPLPEWAKPFASLVGLHYWQFLVVASLIVAVIVSVLTFASVYAQIQGM